MLDYPTEIAQWRSHALLAIVRDKYMNLLKWLGFTQKNQRYGPDFYEIIFSKSGGRAHALRINIFYVRRFLSLAFVAMLSASLWLAYVSYTHHQLSEEIAQLEQTKAHLKQLEQEKRKQRIAQDVIEGDYAKLVARLYDVEQQVQKIVQRDQWSKKRIKPLNPSQKPPNAVGGEENTITPQQWMQIQGLDQLQRIEQHLQYLQALPRGMPVSPLQTRLSSPFGYRGNPFTGQGKEFHNGLDFASKTGTPIYATAHGKVIAAGAMGGLGNAVKIDHGHGFQTAFGHMSKVLVREGSEVEAGDLIGLVGSTGRSSGPHLHYIVYYQQQAINPMQFVN